MMAEKKYDLALHKPSDNSGNIKPWYKESMKTKFLKELRAGEKFIHYDTKSWLFLRQGLTDFRDGLPPIGRRPNKFQTGLASALQSDFVKIADLKPPTAIGKLNKYKSYLSKLSPQQLQQRQYISTVEETLLKHPLALFPHLEQSVFPEHRALLKYFLKTWRPSKGTKKVFENIVNILDPQFTSLDLQDEELPFLDKEDDEEMMEQLLFGKRGGSSLHADDEKPKLDVNLGSDAIFRNNYRWLPQKENIKESKKNKEKEKMWPTSQSEVEHIKKVTQEFCDWVANLGGETNNIEESTMTSLFASGYETKPALSVPIHIVDLANVPHELRLSAMVPPPAPPEKVTTVTDKPKKTRTDEYEPTFVKFRYGAWYLDPKTWKKMGYYEPLEDPKQLKEHELTEAKKRSHELTEELASMHASKAFDEFILKKNTRRPEFLVEIAEIQRKSQLEEAKQEESEMLAKQKKLSKQKET